MLKKIFIFIVIVICVVPVFNILIFANENETPSTTIPSIVENTILVTETVDEDSLGEPLNVYSYIEDENSAVITIYEDIAKIDATLMVEEELNEGTVYSSYILEGNTLKITLGEEIWYVFNINDDNTLEMIGTEDFDTSIEEEEEVKHDAFVVIETTKFGSIFANIEEGNTGDVVKLTIASDFLYELEYVKVNDIELEMDDEGYYTFTLKEGVNKITSSFVVCDEKVEQFAAVINNAKNGNWEEIFNVTNLLTLISWAITTFCSGGFFITLIKNKKQKAMTMEELRQNVKEMFSNMLPQELAAFLSDVFSPSINVLLEKMDSMSKSNEILVHCFILMQENTPESRLAILNELGKIKHDEDELTLKVKTLIEDEIKKREENAQKLEESIEEVKTTNNSIPRL